MTRQALTLRDRRLYSPGAGMAPGEEHLALKTTEGSLAESSFCEVLAGLSRRRETGVLRVSGAAPSKSVYLQEGKIVFASSTDPDDRLGELLLTRGIIARDQLEEASNSLKPGKRL